MHMNHTSLARGSAVFALLFARAVFATLTVTAPGAGSSTIAAGDDFATQVIGDAWDMNNAQDIDTDESASLNSQTFSGGVFSAVDPEATGGCSLAFFPLFMGYGTQTVAIARGQKFAINTGVYRYFTMKIKATPGAAAETNRILFFQNGDRLNIGSSTFGSVTPNVWNIQTWDFNTDIFVNATYTAWTALGSVRGIEVAMCNNGSPNIQVDWIRVTAPPTAAQMFNVTWNDTGGASTYTITAIDADNARFTFASGVGGTAYVADFSRLAPGDYHVEVKRADNTTAISSGVVHINVPPQVNISAPSERGEQALSYALTEQGTQWGPISAADFKSLVNFKNISYTNPSGSFSGRPTNNDPEFIMNTTGHAIDASYYRSACFTLEVFGPRSVGGGSIARLFWGVSSAAVSTTTDIVLGNGLVEYCMADLADSAAVPLVGGSPQPWSGNLGYFRFDPDELTPPMGCATPQTCHDVRLDSIVVAPFAAADPSYTVQWTINDSDFVSGGSAQLLLDTDRTFGNGNEIPLATVGYSVGSYTFIPAAHANVASGTYNLVILADDGRNSVAHYAGGPIVVHSDLIFRNGFEGP